MSLRRSGDHVRNSVRVPTAEAVGDALPPLATEWTREVTRAIWPLVVLVLVLMLASAVLSYFLVGIASVVASVLFSVAESVAGFYALMKTRSVVVRYFARA